MSIRILFAFLIINFVAFNIIYSQENTIILGANKINNTYINTGILNYKTNTNFGEFEIYNHYTGRIITNVLSSFRDMEDFNLNYRYEIWDNIFAISETKYNLISDRNNLLNNRLEKISEQVGLSGVFFDKLFIKAIYGLQHNKQAELKSIGNLINTSVLLDDLSFDGWNISGALISEHLLLNDTRRSNDINVAGKLWKRFDANEFLNLELRYERSSRDFIQSISNTTRNNISDFAIETNKKNRIEGNISSKFELFAGLIMNVEGNVGIVNVDYKYREYIVSINNSRTGRNYNEWTGDVDLSIDYKHNVFFHNFGIGLNNRNEHYYLENIHSLDLADFNIEQMTESQKDNNTFTFKLFYNPIIAITRKDSLLANIILSKTEYNTPSTANNDERDVLNHIFSFEYRRQCSKILTTISKINYLQNHTVFIHKERSSHNNWNRIISYQNGIIINAANFYYAPSFEVLANYTIYDFEIFSTSVRSYSIRQISYRDTMSVAIINNLYLTNKINFRYYEQSKLFWSSFSEQPQRQSADITSIFMFRYDFDNYKKIGLGMRLYYFDAGIINISNNRNIIYSYAPEILFNFRINKWIFYCNTWCEFQNGNNNKRIIPHFSINTSYSL